MRYLARLSLILVFSANLAAESFQEITVAPGDTMWSIANKYLKDPRRWPDIVKHNNLPTSDPTIALPGTKIKIPVSMVKEEYQNAELVSSIPEVRFKRKGAADWQPTKDKMLFNYEDSLRTMKGGQARVRFPTRETIQINENSYVVLKPDKILQEIQLVQGDVRASKAKVILPQGTVVKPRGTNSDYSARVREDETEVVFVYKGKVDVTAQGKTITVPEGFGTHVPKFSPPQTPKPLPEFSDFNPKDMPAEPPPTTMKGKNSGEITIKPPAQAPKESIGGGKSMVAKNLLANYHLQLAADENFKKVLVEKTQSIGEPFDIKKQNIKDGTYYMRVAFIDALGVVGGYSEPAELIKDTTAPEIRDLVPEDGKKLTGDEVFVDVTGFVSGASSVSVNGEVVFITPEGRFNRFLTIPVGVTEIKVVARDTQGNETVVIRKVTYSK